MKTPREALWLRTQIRRGTRLKSASPRELAELRFRHDVVMGLSELERGAVLIRTALEKQREDAGSGDGP